VLAEYGADAVRYWAAGGRPGQDTIFDTNVFKVGRRLATKILNASRFALGFEAAADGIATAPLDVAMLTRLAGVIADATDAFESYDYTRALERIEPFFWSFCDDYLELVKGRAYAGDTSAGAALRAALSILLRLFAPFLPFVTEEVWSWWQEGSVHRAPWPEASSPGGDELVLDVAGFVLREVRKAKTAAKKSLRADVARIVVRGTAAQLAALEAARGDVTDAGRVAVLDTEPGDNLAVDVTLSE
jgi:valyl-tRNA synthetase